MPSRISISTFNKIDEMIQDSGFTFTEIAACCGVANTVVSQIARGLHYYQADPAEQARRRGDGNSRDENAAHYVPTPEEIAAACDELRATKREPEGVGWTPPVYTMLDLIGA